MSSKTVFGIAAISLGIFCAGIYVRFVAADSRSGESALTQLGQFQPADLDRDGEGDGESDSESGGFLDRVRAIDDHSEQWRIMDKVMAARIAAGELDQLLAEIRQLGDDPSLQLRCLRGAMDGADANQLIRIAEAGSDFLSTPKLHIFGRNLGNVLNQRQPLADPVAVLNLLPVGTGRDGFLASYFRQLSDIDGIRNSLDLLEKLELSGDFRSLKTMDKKRFAGAFETEELIAFVRENPEVDQKLVPFFADVLAQKSLEKNLDFTYLHGLLPEHSEALQKSVFSAIASSQSHEHLAKALQNANIPIAPQAQESIADALYYKSGLADSYRFFQNLERQDLGTIGLQRLVFVSFTSEPEITSEWVASLDRGMDRDLAIITMTKWMSPSTESAEIEAWRNSVTDQTLLKK